MGKFRVTLEDGSNVVVTTEEPPEPTTGGLAGRIPVSKFEEGERNIAGNIFERPAAAVRGGILSAAKGESPLKGFQRGSIDPSKVPTFTELSQKAPVPQIVPFTGRKGIIGTGQNILAGAERFQKGLQRDIAATVADIGTNPAEALLSILTAGVSKTIPGQAVGRFLTKERGIVGRGILRKLLRTKRKLKGDVPIPAKEQVAGQIKTKGKLKAEELQGVKERSSGIVEDITNQIVETRVSRTKALEKAKTQLEKKILKSADRIDDEVLQLTDDLQRSAETGSLEFQKRIPKSQRVASNEYGLRLDEISDDLISRGEGVTVQEMRDTIINTLGEMQEMALPESRVQTVMQNILADRYPIGKSERVVALKDVLADVKNIRGQLSGGVKAGTNPFSDSELGVVIFNKNWGTLLEKKAPALIELNKSYAPVIRVNKAAHRIFKPRAGELQTKAGTGLLKKAATKKVVKGKISQAPTIERGERQLLNILEEGTEFGKGIGKISEPTKRIGERIAGREVAKVKGKEVITKAGEIKKERISTQFEKRLSSLEKRKETVSKISENKEEIIAKEFDKRLDQLAEREVKVKQLVRNKAKVNEIRRLVVRGVITTSIAIGLIRGFFGLKRQFNR